MSVSSTKTRQQVTQRPPSAVPQFPVKRYTVSEYLALLEHGTFADCRVELWEGWLVDRMTHGSLPAMLIMLLSEWFFERRTSVMAIRTQIPVNLEHSCPEPDLAIVKGTTSDYADRFPGSEDILLLIEVSDSTLQDDREIKGRIYARAGVPEYWIINCEERQVEIYSDPNPTAKTPRYRKQLTYLPGQSFPVTVSGKKLGELAVNTLFGKKKST